MRQIFGAALLTLLALASALPAQELRREPVPFSVWLDFQALVKANPPRLALPIWLESITSDHPRRQAGEPVSTVYRLRLRRAALVSKELHMRLFFDDDPVAWPSVTGWTETGVMKFSSGPLGSGLGLPSSSTLLIPADQVDYVEIAVMGDGGAIRGAFLSSATRLEITTTVDLARAAEFVDPFGKLPEARPAGEDSYLFGRVRAALLAEPTKLSPEAPITLDFQLDRQPLLAVVSFEVLDTDISAPPLVSVNGTSTGRGALQLPDLADPAYRGEAVAKRADIQFRYTGWLHCERIVPASALRAGVNQLTLSLPRGSQTVAIRALEIQLKYEWDGLNVTGAR